MNSIAKRICPLYFAVLICCYADDGRASIPDPTSSAFHADPSAFLILSNKVEPWFPAGIIGNDRSARFLQRLREAGTNGNVLAEGFLGMLLVTGDGVTPDKAEGLHLLSRSAESGCLPAMDELGYIYLEGRFGVPTNRTEALKWIRTAADRGWANAQCNLGYCCERGLGIEVDLVEAAKWYRLAADQGHPAAKGALGVFYMEGRGGITPDHALAERLLGEAVEKGNIRAKLNLGYLYVEKGYRTNMFETGTRLIREAAEAGDFRAQAHLAHLYFYGKGLPKDLTNYFFWTRKAAEQGLAEAQLNMANALGAGQIAKQNLAEARQWAEKAAHQGLPGACFVLANMLARGDGGEKDSVKAAEWFNKAAIQGHRAAQFRLALAYWNGDGVKTNIAEGTRWIRISAESGWPMAEFTFALCLLNGQKGVTKSTQEGVSWLRKAAEDECLEAQCILGIKRIKGVDLPRDPEEGTKWFRRAAEHGYAKAQNDLGYAIETKETASGNLVDACAWYLLAVNGGIGQAAKINADRLVRKLNQEQLEEVMRRVQNFKPNPVPELTHGK